MIGSTILICY